MSKPSTNINRRTIKRVLAAARGPLTECAILDNLKGSHSARHHLDLEKVLAQMYKAHVVETEGSPQGFVWKLTADKQSEK